MGGYVFRWYSPLWDKYYVLHKRFPDSWLPGENEHGPYSNPDWDLQRVLHAHAQR